MFLTDGQLTTELQNMLQQPDGFTAAYWPTLITSANLAAYQDIVARLAARGYSPAQIAAWDRGAEFQKDIGIYWALLRGAGLSKDAYDVAKLKPFDRRLELWDPKNAENSVPVTINGLWVAPANDLQTATGPIDTSEDLFPSYLDPADSRIGDPHGPRF